MPESWLALKSKLSTSLVVTHVLTCWLAKDLGWDSGTFHNPNSHSSQKSLLMLHTSELAVTGHLGLEVNSRRDRSFRVRGKSMLPDAN